MIDSFRGVYGGLRVFKKEREPNLSIILSIVISFMVFFGSAVCGGVNPPISPVVKTDQGDYQPGQIAIITGSGFNPKEQVRLQVVHTNPVKQSGIGHEPWYIIADAYGRFSSEWFVSPDDSLGASALSQKFRPANWQFKLP